MYPIIGLVVLLAMVFGGFAITGGALASSTLGYWIAQRFAGRGATTTDVNASATPHPKKTSPISWAPMSSGNGVNASRVKKPML